MKAGNIHHKNTGGTAYDLTPLLPTHLYIHQNHHQLTPKKRPLLPERKAISVLIAIPKPAAQRRLFLFVRNFLLDTSYLLL
jgi:hypothetical protein